jgi:transmembrane sensor
MNSGRRLTEEAAHWYLTLREDTDAHTRDRFAGWLRRSPQHVAEYLAVAQLHGDMRAAAAMEGLPPAALRELAASEPSVVPLRRGPDRPQVAASRRRGMPRGLRIGAATAAILVLALATALLVASAVHDTPATRYVAEPGGVRMVTLDDDTRVQLAPGSIVDVRFDARARHIALVSGSASFDIGKDPRRPMTVAAGNQRIDDIGTVFDVSVGPAATEVSVVSGRVSISQAASSWLDRARRRLTGGDAPWTHVTELGGGESARVSREGALLSKGAQEAPAATWLPDEIRFHDSTVAEVARRFNAYTPRPLAIEDPALARKRISGVFHARDAAAFVSYLASLPGVAVIHDPERIRFVPARGTRRL